MKRRHWLQQSLLASSALLTAGPLSASVMKKDPIGYQSKDSLRLHYNENPYGPPASSIERVTMAVQEANYYSYKALRELKEQISKLNNCSEDNVLITAGATEIMSLLGQHVGLIQGDILVPWPSMPAMVDFAKTCGARVKKVPLQADQSIDLNGILSALDNNSKLIYICNPHNPTGTLLSSTQLWNFAKEVPKNVLICIDEAYIEYTDLGINDSLSAYINELPNLIISRTFSKGYGLAGMRIAYALSNPMNINVLRRRHLGFENSAGIAPLTMALAALEDEKFLNMVKFQNEEAKTFMYESFDKLGVSYTKTHANFIQVDGSKFDPNIVTKLAERKIYITQWEGMDSYLRITLGKHDHLRKFLYNAEQMMV